MAWFIFAIIFFVAALGFVIGGVTTKRVFPWLIAIGLVFVGAFFMWASTFWSNGVGEAKVIVNSVDRTVVGVIETPGSGFKAPWEDFVDFDLFAQELTYAGGADAPSYTGGTVNGREITVSVGGVNGGSTQGNIDATFVYSLDASKVADLYDEFKSQERFTKMIVEKSVLSVARQVPSAYSAIDFRGTDRASAELAMLDALNERLGKYGVEFSQPTIQDVRYPEAIEASIAAIETANQDAQKAEADQRTATAVAEKNRIQAEGEAAATIERARGEAEANALISGSLTPSIVELRRIEALQKAAESGNLVIDGSDGSVFLDAR